LLDGLWEILLGVGALVDGYGEHFGSAVVVVVVVGGCEEEGLGEAVEAVNEGHGSAQKRKSV